MEWHIRIAISIVLFPGTLLGSVIPLNKVFHHQGAKSNHHSIEFGSLVFYFDDAPRVESSMITKGNEVHHHFFLPSVEVTKKECEQAIDKINKAKDLPYSVAIVSQQTPRKGIEIVLKYPKDAVGIKYSRFASIKLQKGLVIRLFNKRLLRQMNNASKGIIATAQLDRRPQVFIDCGHGGADKGAVSFATEKEVSLQVGLQIAELLGNHNVDVNLSRTADTTLDLDERTSVANQKKADVFVSLHANAADAHCSGIETYLFAPHLLITEGSSLTSSEQEVHTKFEQEQYLKSTRLADCVHTNLISNLQEEATAKDRHIKPAVSQVLLGTHMPSILVELGFVTHPQEARLLTQQSYQECLANGIVNGILKYFL